MAKQVTDIRIRLGIDGLKGLDTLKSSFKDLQKALDGPTTASLERARRSINEFGDASKRTEQLIKGQLEALKGLRTQTDVSSATYKRLITDISRLETELRGSSKAVDSQREALLRNASAGRQNADSLEQQIQALTRLQQQARPGSSAFIQLARDIDAAKTKLAGFRSEAQAFSSALNQGFGATPERLGVQIATLQQGIRTLRYNSEEYLNTLRRIQLMQLTQGGRAGRAGVIAGFEAYRSREFTAGYADPSRLPAMPDTTAALNQELSELTKQLDNVSRGGTEYVAVSLRISDIQKQLRSELLGTTEAFRRLGIAQAGTERRAEKLAGIQEYYRTQGPTAPGVAGFRDPETGAMIARGTRVQTGIRPGTQYEQPVGPVAYPAAAVQAESSIKQAQQRITEIYDEAYVRRAQLQSDYNQINIDKLLYGLDMEGKVRNQAFDRELADFDKRLEQRERSRRRRITPGQLVQAGGAAISGGIFGGPEGFLGGVGGAAVGSLIPGLGTVGGSFAGAAAGAQVGMFRQQLAGTADYAASIGKLQIALRGVVGSQAAYDQAIRAAAAATRDLNIPQEEATRGLTRLSAAVIGAGGTVADSSFAFRSMSEAIKATGGNAEQVDGALLALTQVFSKGKVSAEELNQIAERLPGTFTLFAQAAGKTGPELQKALEQGQVGLNDLMKFLALTSQRYGTTALEIASSSQDAGARLTVAFQAMRLEVGKALQPLGAELQNAFANFIKDITPAVVASVKAVADVLKFFITNETASGLAKFALNMGLVSASLVALKAAASGIVALNIASWFTGAATGAKITGDAAATSAVKVGMFRTAALGLFGVLKSIAAIGIITASVNIVVNNLGRLLAAKDAIDKLKKEKDVTGETGPRLVMTAERRYTGASREKVTEDVNKQVDLFLQYNKQLRKTEKRLASLRVATSNPLYLAPLEAEKELLELRIQSAKDVINLDLNRFQTQKQLDKQRAADLEKRFASPAGDEKGAKSAADKAARAAETRAADQQRLNETLMQQRLRVEDAVFKHQVELDRQRYELQKRLDDIQADNRIARETGVSREIVSSFEQLRQRLREIDERSTEATRRTAAARQTLTSAQQQAAVTGGSAPSGRGLPTGMAGYISGDPRSAFYQADHGGSNYHEHVAFVSRKAAEEAYNKLIKAGIKVTEFKGMGRVGQHTPGSAHYSGLAFDVPGAQVPVGQEPQLTARVKALLGVGRTPTGVAAQGLRAVRTVGKADEETTDLAAAQAQEAGIRAAAPAERAATLTNFILNQTSALREQNATQQRNNELQTYRNTLTGQFTDSNYVEFLVDLKEKQLLLNETQNAYTELITQYPEFTETLTQTLQGQNDAYAERTRLLTEAYNAQQLLNGSMSAGFTAGANQYLQSLGSLNQATAQLAQTGFKGVEDAIFDLVTTGTTNFAAFAASILRDTARMIIQQLVMKSIMQAIGFIGGPAAAVGNPTAPGGDVMGAIGRLLGNANGNAFATNNIVPYAMGGLVTKPTLFRYANGGVPGTGLMGEAGPEAIMPLRRLPNGRLGVESSSSASPTIIVNVDAKGSSVEGDEGQSKALAGVISAAVQSELVKQKRPGGLLAGTR